MKPMQASLKLRNRVFESEESRRQYYLQCAREALPIVASRIEDFMALGNGVGEEDVTARAACLLGFSMMKEAENLWQEMRTMQQREEVRDA